MREENQPQITMQRLKRKARQDTIFVSLTSKQKQKRIHKQKRNLQ